MHNYRGALLANVWLASGYTKHQTKWGEGFSYEDLDGLFDAIANAVCLSDMPLDGAAVRFLRKRLGLTQQELGKEMGVSDQAVAKWEKGTTEVPVACARLLKALAVKQFAPKLDIEIAVPHYGQSAAKIVLGYDPKSGWYQEGAAVVHVKHVKFSNPFVSSLLSKATAMGGRLQTEHLKTWTANEKWERHESKLLTA